MGTIFLPLTWQVWLLHLLMIVFGGLAIVAMEATSKDSLLNAHMDQREENSEGDYSPNGILMSTYKSIIHFLWNGPVHMPNTGGGKLALFGLSFHTLIIAASYTASLAGFLSTSSTLPIEIYSFQEVQSSGPSSVKGKLCVLQSAQVRFKAKRECNSRPDQKGL